MRCAHRRIHTRLIHIKRKILFSDITHLRTPHVCVLCLLRIESNALNCVSSFLSSHLLNVEDWPLLLSPAMSSQYFATNRCLRVFGMTHGPSRTLGMVISKQILENDMHVCACVDCAFASLDKGSSFVPCTGPRILEKKIGLNKKLDLCVCVSTMSLTLNEKLRNSCFRFVYSIDYYSILEFHRNTIFKCAQCFLPVFFYHLLLTSLLLLLVMLCFLRFLVFWEVGYWMMRWSHSIYVECRIESSEKRNV